MEEICTRDRLAPFETLALLLSQSDHLLVQVVRKNVGQIFSLRLGGSDPREFTHAGEGLSYGLNQSPNGQRVAYHLVGPQGYQVFTSNTDGSDRIRIAAQSGHLYFGTSWSPDGRWILYVDCLPGENPGHDWADVCIGCAQGAEHRVLTSGKAMWLAATYGDGKTRGGGSNVPGWTRVASILFSRRLPDFKVSWEFQPGCPGVDHVNRDFKPELARGGSVICRHDPHDGRLTTPTRSVPRSGISARANRRTAITSRSAAPEPVERPRSGSWRPTAKCLASSPEGSTTSARTTRAGSDRLLATSWDIAPLARHHHDLKMALAPRWTPRDRMAIVG